MDGKNIKDSMKDNVEHLKNLLKLFREIWREAKTDGLCHHFKRFILFARLSTPDTISIEQMKILLFVLAIISELLKELIYIIEHSAEEDLIQYEQWLKKAKNSITHISKSDAFRGTAISAISAGVFVVAANGGLSVLGFTAVGIQAGSLAAAWMSSIGNVASGSLFAALQSAGVIGFSVSATVGIGLVGVAVGGVGYGIYKLATMVTDFQVLVYNDFEIGDSKALVMYNSNSTLQDVLLQYLPVDVFIPSDLIEIGVKLVDPTRPQRIESIKTLDLKQKARKVLDKRHLLVFRRDPTTDLPFYLIKQREYWVAEVNAVE